jgi:hypothetical protein
VEDVAGQRPRLVRKRTGAAWVAGLTWAEGATSTWHLRTAGCSFAALWLLRIVPGLLPRCAQAAGQPRRAVYQRVSFVREVGRRREKFTANSEPSRHHRGDPERRRASSAPLGGNVVRLTKDQGRLAVPTGGWSESRDPRGGWASVQGRPDLQVSPVHVPAGGGFDKPGRDIDDDRLPGRPLARVGHPGRKDVHVTGDDAVNAIRLARPPNRRRHGRPDMDGHHVAGQVAFGVLSSRRATGT